jgi:hypothetical protein
MTREPPLDFEALCISSSVTLLLPRSSSLTSPLLERLNQKCNANDSELGPEYRK